jgi:prepilin-type N-terminal cleavage/methylation domain-containing protein
MTLRRLRSDDAGFSLIELLMAMAIGSIVLAALLTVFMGGVRGSMKSTDRVDALRRGRIAMDRVVTLLNSQSCLIQPDGSSSSPILDGQTNQIAFYAALGVVDSAPSIYRLRYDPPTRRLYEDEFKPKVDSATKKISFTYPGTATTSRVLGTNIIPEAPGAPIFKYWQFVTDEGPTLGMIDTTPLATPLDVTGRQSAVRLTIGFVTQPEKSTLTTAEKRATTLQGVATVGSANAGEPTKGVNC